VEERRRMAGNGASDVDGLFAGWRRFRSWEESSVVKALRMGAPTFDVDVSSSSAIWLDIVSLTEVEILGETS
jgi:hypothetical protein